MAAVLVLVGLLGVGLVRVAAASAERSATQAAADAAALAGAADGRGAAARLARRNGAELTSYDGPVVHGPSKQGEVYKIYLDASRARRELGWYPKMPLETGLARTVEYFRTSILVPAGKP